MAGTAILVAITIGGPAQASDNQLCGWTGKVGPLMAQADAQVREADLPAALEPFFGTGVVVFAWSQVQVDLRAPSEAAATNARELTRNTVTYSVRGANAQGNTFTATVRMRYRGMCLRKVAASGEPWVATDETGPALRVGPKRALELAQAYRAANPVTFPLASPLRGMSLQRPATEPRGRLRWYVLYSEYSLAVYMNGHVRPYIV